VINFRYHLVSMAAVFLALGVGLLLGSIVLKPYVQQGLQALSRTEKKQIDQLHIQQRMLNTALSRNEQFAQAAEAQLIGHLLAGQRVVVVTAPSAPGPVTDGVSQLLGRAGAVVTGQVQLQQAFFLGSTAGQHALSQLAQSLVPVTGITLRQGSGAAQASQVLASALLTRDGPGQPLAGQADQASRTVISQFTAKGLLTTAGGNPAARATLAVVVIPDPPPSVSDTNHASQALVTVAEALELAGKGTVVAGSLSGSGPGSAIDVMRNDGRAPSVSSVDNADKTIGQIVTIQALDAQMSGVSGSYGWLPTANQAGPSPAPSPSTGLATATAPPTRSRHARLNPAPPGRR
jgi:Copper transport outer membrane protein, MctB